MTESTIEQDLAADDGTVPEQPAAPADDDAQEVAIDAVLAGDEDDAPAEETPLSGE